MKLYPNISLFFIIWLISILIIALLSFETLPHSGKFGNDFFISLTNWDGGHYLGIAQKGYSQKFQYAFFPLYPLMIKAVSSLIGNYQVAAILISVVATYFGLHLLYKLILDYFDKKIAEKAIWILLFFPASFFFITAYSEGLFFFLSVLTFYLLFKKKLFWAMLVASLASATRLTGLALIAGIWIESFTTNGFNKKNWYIIFAPLGFFIYCFFLFKQTGDPFYFLTAEEHWQRSLAIPGVGFWETIKEIFSRGFINLNFNIILDLLFAIFGVGYAIRSFRFLPTSLSVYSLLAVGIPLFTPTLTSMPRFLLIVFPLFILIALMKNRYLQFAWQLFSTLLLAIFTALFITGYWVS